jgi:hypothetical protein
MTAASAQGLQLMADIDRATLLGVASYQPLIALRTQIRGGSGVGRDIIEGRVPVLEMEPVPHYDVNDGDAPLNFIAETSMSFGDAGGLMYRPLMVSVLPAFVLREKMADAYLQDYADLVLQAIYRGRSKTCDSIPDRLRQSSLDAAASVRYRVLSMGIDGGDFQPRLMTRIEFVIPFGIMSATTQGIVEG